MASLKKLVPLLALGATVAAGAGGFAYYKHLETRDRQKREQLFADLGQCLVGRVVTSDAEILADYAALEAWTMHRPPEMRGKAQGGAWPDRCGARAHALMDAARDSAFIDKDTKVAQLDAVGILANDLDAQEKKRSPCAGDVASLWRQAGEQHWAMASSSTVAGPSRPTMMDGAPETPFASLLPLEGGPEWAFLTAPRDKGALGFCTLSATGLACSDLSGDGHVNVAGAWESASFIPVLSGGELQLLRDGAIENAGIKGFAFEAYADRDGTLYALVADGEKRALAIKRLGKKARVTSLDDAVSAFTGFAEGAAERSRLVGKSVLVPGEQGWSRFPILDNGNLGEPARVEGAQGTISTLCRTGPSIAVQFGISNLAYLFDGAAVTRRTVLGAIKCGEAGELWSSGQLCTAKDCHDPLPTSIRERLHESGAVGLAGDKVVTAWLVSAGRGMLARVAPDGDASDTPDVVIAPKTDVEEHQRVAIFGGPKGAIALAETKSGLIGAHVTSDGKVEPLRIDKK